MTQALLVGGIALEGIWALSQGQTRATAEDDMDLAEAVRERERQEELERQRQAESQEELEALLAEEAAKEAAHQAKMQALAAVAERVRQAQQELEDREWAQEQQRIENQRVRREQEREQQALEARERERDLARERELQQQEQERAIAAERTDRSNFATMRSSLINQYPAAESQLRRWAYSPNWRNELTDERGDARATQDEFEERERERQETFAYDEDDWYDYYIPPVPVVTATPAPIEETHWERITRERRIAAELREAYATDWDEF